jgi:hypothetical protein
VPDVVYKQYSIRSEHSVFVDFKDDDGNPNNFYTSTLWIENNDGRDIFWFK